MQNIIATHASAMPAYGFGDGDGAIILTVLTKGVIGDCAAYQAVVRDTSLKFSYVEAFKGDVAAGGNKISKSEAEKMFDLGDMAYRE